MGVDAPGSMSTRFDGGEGRSGRVGPSTLAIALGSTGVLLAASVLGDPEPTMPLTRDDRAISSRQRLDAASWLSEPNGGDRCSSTGRQ